MDGASHRSSPATLSDGRRSYPPAGERTSSRMQDVEMRRTFHRLDTNRAINKLIQPRKPPCTLVLPSVSLPQTEGFQCTCYETVMEMIQQNALVVPPSVYRVYATKPLSKPTIDTVRPSWIRRAVTGFQDNAQLQYPLGTVVVRWQLKRTLPHYDIAAVRHLLQELGTIRELRAISQNSCLAVFSEISAACSAVQARNLGYAANRLHCSWWHKVMENKNVFSRTKGVAIKTDPFVVMRSGA